MLGDYPDGASQFWGDSFIHNKYLQQFLPTIEEGGD
jgi:hypothetical protein